MGRRKKVQKEEGEEASQREVARGVPFRTFPPIGSLRTAGRAACWTLLRRTIEALLHSFFPGFNAM